jgi:hypothetical protein
MEQHWSSEEVRDAEVWMEEAVGMSLVFTFLDLITGPGPTPEDAGTSDSTTKIRPGHDTDIMLFASSHTSVV